MIIEIDFNSDEALYMQLRNQIISKRQILRLPLNLTPLL